MNREREIQEKARRYETISNRIIAAIGPEGKYIFSIIAELENDPTTWHDEIKPAVWSLTANGDVLLTWDGMLRIRKDEEQTPPEREKGFRKRLKAVLKVVYSAKK